MNVFPTIYNTLAGWMSRYPFSSKPTSTKPTVHSWGHSSTDSSCGSYEDHSQSADTTTPHDDLILAQIGMAWQQTRPQPQLQSQRHCHQRSSRPAVPLSPSPSTTSTAAEDAFIEDPWRSHHIFVESQVALAAAQRRFLRSVVRATRAHLDGRVDQDEVAMFGLHYPDARARVNQGFSGQNHLRLDEWDRSLERAREELRLEAIEIAQKMQYLHVDAMRELIGHAEDMYDAEVGVATVPVASSSSTSLPTPATSPEPSRKRGLDDSDEKAVDCKATSTGRLRPLKRARIEIIKTEDRDLVIPPVPALSSSLSAAAEALIASSPSSAPSPPPTSPKRASQTSAARRRRRTTRSTRSGTKKSH